MTSPTLLLIGTGLHGLAAGLAQRCRARVLLYPHIEPPGHNLLVLIDAVFVFAVENPARLKQLQYCCEWHRAHGHIRIVAACSRNLDAHLAAKVEAAGARFIPLTGMPK